MGFINIKTYHLGEDFWFTCSKNHGQSRMNTSFSCTFFFVYIYILYIYTIYIYINNLLFLQHFPRSQYHNSQCSPALPLTSPSKPFLFFFDTWIFTVLRSLLPLSPKPVALAFKRRNQAYLTQGILGRALGHAQDALELARSPSPTVDPPCSYCLFFWGWKPTKSGW